jgi:hypothetical protein
MGAGNTERAFPPIGGTNADKKTNIIWFLSWRVSAMMRIFTCVFLFLGNAMASAQSLRTGMTIPQIKGTTLEEQAIILPDAVRGKVTLLIITFSKAGGELGRGWNDPLFKDYPQDDRVTSYAIAMLEDVPSLLRGVVRGGIKRGVPLSMRRRFLTVNQDENKWKEYVGVKNDKDPYLVLFDANSRVQWIHHGAFDPTEYGGLKARIAELVSSKIK